jgi:hypothetical protein
MGRSPSHGEETHNRVGVCVADQVTTGSQPPYCKAELSKASQWGKDQCNSLAETVVGVGVVKLGIRHDGCAECRSHAVEQDTGNNDAAPGQQSRLPPRSSRLPLSAFLRFHGCGGKHTGYLQ